MRVAVPVPRTGRNDHRAGPDAGEERGAARVPAPVMSRVEELGAKGIAERADERCLARRSQISGQEEPAGAGAQEQHSRAFVRRDTGCVEVCGNPGLARMEDVDRDPALRQPASGAQRLRGRQPVRARDEIEVRVARRNRPPAPPPPDVHAREHAADAADMVHVRVRRDQPIEPADPLPPQPREHRAPPLVAPVPGPPRVDEPRRPVREADRDRVSLPDVEPGHFPDRGSRGPRGERERERGGSRQGPDSGPSPPDQERGAQADERGRGPAHRPRNPRPHRPCGQGHRETQPPEGERGRAARGARERLGRERVQRQTDPDERERQPAERDRQRVHEKPAGGDPAEGGRLHRERPRARGRRGDETGGQPAERHSAIARSREAGQRPDERQQTRDRGERQREAEVEHVGGPPREHRRRGRPPPLPRRYLALARPARERERRHDRRPDDRRRRTDQARVSGEGEGRPGRAGRRRDPRERENEREEGGQESHVEARDREEVERPRPRERVGESRVDPSAVAEDEGNGERSERSAVPRLEPVADPGLDRRGRTLRRGAAVEDSRLRQEPLPRAGREAERRIPGSGRPAEGLGGELPAHGPALTRGRRLASAPREPHVRAVAGPPASRQRAAETPSPLRGLARAVQADRPRHGQGTSRRREARPGVNVLARLRHDGDRPRPGQGGEPRPRPEHPQRKETSRAPRGRAQDENGRRQGRRGRARPRISTDERGGAHGHRRRHRRRARAGQRPRIRSAIGIDS